MLRDVRLPKTALATLGGDRPGHPEQIGLTAMAPGGQTLFSLSQDSVVAAWAMESGARLGFLPIPEPEPHRMLVPLDERTVLLALQNQGAHAWCPGQAPVLLPGAFSDRLLGGQGCPEAACRGGEWIAVLWRDFSTGTRDDGAVLLLRTVDLSVVGRLEVKLGWFEGADEVELTGVIITPDGSTVAATASLVRLLPDGSRECVSELGVMAWDTRTRALLWCGLYDVSNGSSQPHLAVSDDGRQLALSHGWTSVFDLTSGEVIAKLGGPGDDHQRWRGAECAGFLDADTLLLVTRLGLERWSLSRQSRLQQSDYPRQHFILGLALGAGRAVVSRERELAFFDLNTLAPIRHGGGHWRDVTAVELADDGALVSSDGERIKRWSGGGAEQASWDRPGAGPLALSPDGSQVLGAGPAGVSCWSESGAVEAASAQAPVAVAWGRRRVFATCAEAAVAVWSWGAAPARVRSLPLPGATAPAAISGDGEVVYCWSASGHWKVWRGDRVVCEGDERWPDVVALSPDGAWLALTSDGCRGYRGLKLLDLSDGTERLLFASYVTPRAAAFSPDGSLMATAIGGGVSLYYTATGKRWKSLKEREGAIRTLAFSPDGRRLLSGHEDGTLTIWKVRR